MKLSSAPPLQPPPPALRSCPEPSSVLLAMSGLEGVCIQLRELLLGSGSPAWVHCLLQIHLYTRGCHSQRNLDHLSVAETEMLRDPESSQQVRVGRVPEWLLPLIGCGLLGNTWLGVRL